VRPALPRQPSTNTRTARPSRSSPVSARSHPAIGPFERPPETRQLRDSERSELHVEQAPSLLAPVRPCPVRRDPPRREIPDTLLAGPAGDHDLALRPEDLEHHRGVAAVVVPPAGSPADGESILERPGGQRPLVTQPIQHVPSEAPVLAEVSPNVRMTTGARARVAPHRLSVHGVLRGRQDERAILEQRAITPQESLELADPEPASQAGPEHEMLRSSHRSCGIHLDASEPLHHLEDRARARRREELCGDSHLARPPERDRPRLGWIHSVCSAASASAFVRWTVPSGCSGGEYSE
jgi:hypothetical protein